MKRFFPCLLVVILILAFSNSSWAQFPCWPGDSVGTNCCGADSGCYPGPACGYSLDLGICDTLHVVPWPETDTCWGGIVIDTIVVGTDTTIDTTCFYGEPINDPGEQFPCFLYVSLFVTHDSNTFYSFPHGDWVQDSIAAFVVPLTFWHPEGGCVDSIILPEPGPPHWWNNTANTSFDGRIGRSLFRNFLDTHVDPPETTYNRMLWLGDNYLGWETRMLNICNDSCEILGVMTPPHAFLVLITTDPTNRRWWESPYDPGTQTYGKVLLATWTFMVYKSEGCDTATICFDSTLWPPTGRLRYARHDGPVYFSRHNLPLCISVGPPPLVVTSPNGGENWCVGKSEEITWSSEGFSGLFVKIEYSTNAGTSWETIEDSTQNDGTYSWTIPDTPSDSCLMKVSDVDGIPYDKSNGFFTIFLAGDANADGIVDIGDVVHLINYSFLNGPAPMPLEAGDVNLDGLIDIEDIVYLIHYLFLNGPVPLC